MNVQLGAPVFQRVGGRLVPTEVGGIYLPEARESVRHARLSVDRVRAFVHANARELHIGYSSQLSERLLEIIARLEYQFAKPVPIERESLLTRHVISKVLDGDLHVGFGFLPLREPDLIVRQLMQEPLLVCLPISHRLTAKNTIEPAELENESIVAVGRKALPGTHEEMVKHFESLGVSLKFAADAYLPKEALWLVSRGAGLALLTRSSAASQRVDIVMRPLSDELLTVKSGIFARRGHNSEVVNEFIQVSLAATIGLRSKTIRINSPIFE